MRTGAIVGISLGIISFIILIIILMWYYFLRQKDGPDQPIIDVRETQKAEAELVTPKKKKKSRRNNKSTNSSALNDQTTESKINISNIPIDRYVSDSEPDIVSDHSINVNLHPGAKANDDLEFSAFDNPYPSIHPEQTNKVE